MMKGPTVIKVPEARSPKPRCRPRWAAAHWAPRGTAWLGACMTIVLIFICASASADPQRAYVVAPGVSPLVEQAYNGLAAIACPTTRECVAVNAGGEDTFDPRSGKYRPRVVFVRGFADTPAVAIAGVACPTADQCTAIRYAGSVISFDPISGKHTHFVSLVYSKRIGDLPWTSPTDLSGVACPSATTCVATDYSEGVAVTFDPRSPRQTVAAKITHYGDTLDQVACPSISLCVATEVAASVFDPLSPVAPSPEVRLAIPNGVKAVACPAVRQCTVVGDDGGYEETFDPSDLATHPSHYRLTSQALAQVACASLQYCVTLTHSGIALSFNPQSPRRPTRLSVGLSGDDAPEAVACPAPRECILVGGNEAQTL